jgi:predicted metal-dependent phosphoesterase TrpH
VTGTAAVFHIHTAHSYDCLASPARIVAWAKRRGIGALAITDHDTIRGAREAAQIAEGTGVQVIIGAEYATDRGDVIGLFLHDDIRAREAHQVMAEIRDQGGISVLPHPYHAHRGVDELAQAADMIEVFNARCSDLQNHRAADLAKALNKPMLAGADAHFVRELGNCVCHMPAGGTITPNDLISAPCRWEGMPSAISGLHWSQVIKGVKTKDATLARAHLRALALLRIRRALGERLYDRLAAIRRKRALRVQRP